MQELCYQVLDLHLLSLVDSIFISLVVSCVLCCKIIIIIIINVISIDGILSPEANSVTKLLATKIALKGKTTK